MRVADDEDRVTRAALAAQGGDRKAVAEFVALTYGQVQRFLGLLCHPRDVEDLTQETYLRVMRSLGRFEARSTARTWLLAIARRTAADHVRKAARRPRTVPLPDPDDTGGGARVGHATGLDNSAGLGNSVGLENEVLLRSLLDTLTPSRRDAFVATQVLGLSYEEAARVCDCPIGTIRSRVARARADLVSAYRHEGARSRREAGA